MKFGICFANTGRLSEPSLAASFAHKAERLGFESLWASHHAVVAADCRSTYPYTATGRMPGSYEADIPDPVVWLAYVAASTRTIRLATGMAILPQLNPVILAKQLATLDRLSGGRLDFGFGIGWMREEFDAVGVPFIDRGGRADEYVGAMRALWTQSKAQYAGRYANFSGCVLRPQPSQHSIPVHIGGHSLAAARRAGSYGDGFAPFNRGVDDLKVLLAEMKRAAIAADRDVDEIEVTTTTTAVAGGALDELKLLQDLGVDRVLIPAGLFTFDEVGTLERYHETVMQAFLDR